MNHNCNKEELLDAMREDLREIKSDVKGLLKFKWQIMGGAGVLGAVISLLISLFK